jgi:hypothetical protein
MLVASWDEHDNGADIDGDVLGSADEYAHAAVERDRLFAGPDDVEYGAVRSGVGCVILARPYVLGTGSGE